MSDYLETPAKKPDFLMEILDWLKYLLIAVLLGLLIVVFVVQRNTVVGDSMVPNLHDTDQLLVEKVTKYFGGITYGDIITIRTDDLKEHEGGPNVIKRVIGKPGDTIEIRDGGIYRNGQPLDESAYLPFGTTTEIHDLANAKVTLGEDEYYVCGDNRMVSMDSRNFGPVPLDSIIGEVLLRFYPLEKFGTP